MNGANLVEDLSFQNGAVDLHAIAAGPKDGPAVVLLHGFPEFWYAWHRQIEPLAAAGFRVIVPDQRGYNLSSKPLGVAAYALNELVSDVIAIADQLGREKIFLAGHDWGAAVAWSAALLHPQRIAKLAVLNVPHPSVMRKFLSTRPRQLLRSWYMFFFQLPWLPEAVFSAFDFRVGVRALLRSSRQGTFLFRRTRPISRSMVSARRSHWNDQPVSRPLPHARQISRQNRPRPHTHPLGRARRLPPGENGSRKPALLHERGALHFRQCHTLAAARRTCSRL